MAERMLTVSLPGSIPGGNLEGDSYEMPYPGSCFSSHDWIRA